MAIQLSQTYPALKESFGTIRLQFKVDFIGNTQVFTKH